MSLTRPEARHRYRAPVDDDLPRKRFREPKHRAEVRKPKHRKPNEVQPRPHAGNFLRYVVMIAMTLLVAFGVRSYAIQMFFIPSQSMEPTLCGGLNDGTNTVCDGRNNDRILVNKVSYKLHGVERRDVVVFARPPSLDDPDKDLVKRVVGIGGDVVAYDNNVLYVNGAKQDESYVNSGCQNTAQKGTPGPVTVPQGQVFVMGDNRCNSRDSRYFGTIPVSTIVGKVFMIVWPMSRIGLVD